jgi:V8-like Glu-specific endopeptidase
LRTWRPSPVARAWLAIAVVLVLTATARRSTGDDPGTPAAQTRPSIGALLTVTAAPTQVCTAAVIDSVAGDVIVTAAHCVSGSTGALMFAPGYHPGDAPFGTWTVTGIYVAPEWQAHADPDADYAFLVVSPSPNNHLDEPVEHAVGGDRLGTAPTLGQHVTVAGYPIARAGKLIACDTIIERAQEYLKILCGGFADGTSGSPILQGADPVTGLGTVTGVIGGLDAGGCSPDVSYASPFTAVTEQVFARAAAKSPADRLPLPPSPSTC